MVKSSIEELFSEGDEFGNTVQPVLKHKYERGVFLSINNYKESTPDLICNLKDYYKSMEYWLYGRNPSMNDIRVLCGKLPSKQKVMDIIAAKGLFVVAAIHNYDRHNHRTGRGSKYNIDYQHLHFYVYGTHHHLPDDETALSGKEKHLQKLLMRTVKHKPNASLSVVNIKPVGSGKYFYSDNIQPTTLYDYLLLPQQEPSKQCLINYLADTSAYEQSNYPLFYIYKQEQSKCSSAINLNQISFSVEV